MTADARIAALREELESAAIGLENGARSLRSCNAGDHAYDLTRRMSSARAALAADAVNVAAGPARGGFPPEDPAFSSLTVFRRSVLVLTRGEFGVRLGYYYPAFDGAWGVHGVEGNVEVAEWWHLPKPGTGTAVTK